MKFTLDWVIVRFQNKLRNAWADARFRAAGGSKLVKTSRFLELAGDRIDIVNLEPGKKITFWDGVSGLPKGNSAAVDTSKRIVDLMWGLSLMFLVIRLYA